MGLFQKQPILDSSSMPLYTLGDNVTLLIVGLGNIGKEYDNTRHNIGFDALDNFAAKQDFDTWVNKKDLFCHQTSQSVGSIKAILCKPSTYMNESGRAVQAIQNFYKIDNRQTLVVYDDIDIPFGQIRTRVGGGSAGHNGIKSITQQIGEDYGRLRIGIGPKTPEQMETSDFVLGKFNKQQREEMSSLFQESSAIISEYIHSSGQLISETRSFLL